jgi:hypothetical protein
MEKLSSFRSQQWIFESTSTVILFGKCYHLANIHHFFFLPEQEKYRLHSNGSKFEFLFYERDVVSYFLGKRYNKCLKTTNSSPSSRACLSL